MGNRLSKIYTRTGDDGSTGLADGNRIAKNAQRVEAMGMADVYYDDGIWPVFTGSISTGGPEPLVEDFKSLQSVFTNMVQGILLQDDSVDNLVSIAGEELDDAL